MRAASLRALKSLSLRRDECLEIGFDDSAELIDLAEPWVSSFCTDVAALRQRATCARPPHRRRAARLALSALPRRLPSRRRRRPRIGFGRITCGPVY